MLEIIILISLFWLPAIVVVWRNILWDLYLWQIKEYRINKMISHLLFQEEDPKYSTPIYIIKVISLILLLLYLLDLRQNFLLVCIVIVFIVYIVEFLINLQLSIGKRLILPEISVRSLLVLSLSFITILIPLSVILYFQTSIYLYIGSNSFIAIEMGNTINLLPREVGDIIVFPSITIALLFSTIFMLVTDLVTPIIVSIYVFATEPFAFIKRYFLIRKAKAKVAQLKNLKIVGITGSFGKTVTKEMLYQLLKKYFRVAQTLQNYNSAVGIAKAVLKEIKINTQVFIAEMGAYDKVEVKKSTDIVKPDISIITGIDNQHLTLFGSIDNIIKAKFEIIRNAKKNTKVILNGDNEYCIRIAGMTDREKLIYFTVSDDSKVVTTNGVVRRDIYKFPRDTSIFASSIKETNRGIKFNLHFLDKKYKLETNIQGSFNVLNLLAAIACCLALNLEMNDIVKTINNTKFKLPYLNRKNGLHSTIILDDGYNINSTGFLAALDELKKINNNRKLIMTKGIIELGWEKEKVYKKIAKKIVNICDGIITSDHKLIEQIKKVKKDFNIYVAKDIGSFIKGYNKMVKANAIVLLEGPMYTEVINEILDIN